MNDSRARELFLDSHRGLLPAAEAAALRAHLAAHPELQREFDDLARTLDALDAMPTPKPSSRLRAGVLAAIEAEKRALRKNPSPSTLAAPAAHRPMWVWFGQSLAACALLALGFLAGIRQAPIASPAQDSLAREAATQRELADLRQQVGLMNENLRLTTLLQQRERPTSDRLSIVLASAKLENPNEKIINELIGSLALDPSANVRLTALEALYPHARQEAVRAGVLASLPREQSPLVQIAMIDFLVAARDREAAPALDRISQSDTADHSVRAAARSALNQL